MMILDLSIEASCCVSGANPYELSLVNAVMQFIADREKQDQTTRSGRHDRTLLVVAVQPVWASRSSLFCVPGC